MHKKIPRIFIGLHEVAGYNTGLKKGFDELGVESIFVELKDHPFKYGEKRSDNVLIRLIKFFGNRIIAIPEPNSFRRIFWICCQQLSKIPLFIWALFKYDVFIFGYKSSFFYFYDLPILKLFGKRIIYIFYGSDSRPPYIQGNYFNVPIQECISLSNIQKKSIKKIERYAGIIVNHPPGSHFHERSFIPIMRMGFPCLINSAGTPGSMLQTNKLRILHAPSDPERKGTEIIRKTIKNLQTKGYSIELIEIIGKPNAQVLEELSRCDFIIDELYSDAVMAGFATEAAFFGKPAVVSGYANAYDWGNLPAESIPPVHYCHPDKIEEAVEKLIVDEAYRKELGRRAKQFVDKQWSARRVAERYLMLIKGDYPDDWLYDPKTIRYLHGWGLPELKVKTLVKNVIKEGGVSALQLSDKPELERMFVDFISSEKS